MSVYISHCKCSAHVERNASQPKILRISITWHWKNHLNYYQISTLCVWQLFPEQHFTMHRIRKCYQTAIRIPKQEEPCHVQKLSLRHHGPLLQSQVQHSMWSVINHTLRIYCFNVQMQKWNAEKVKWSSRLCWILL